MEAILDANIGPFLITEVVAQETLYIHVIIDGVREKVPVTLEPLVASGKLIVVEPETDDEFQEYLDLVRTLDDGEAMTCALALRRGHRIATDERKTIRIIDGRVPIVGSLDMVRAWADEAAVAQTRVREVLAAIADRGYIPGQTHSHYNWWSNILGVDD